METQQETRTLQKPCNCRSSSSGPRLILTKGVPYGIPKDSSCWIGTDLVTARLATLACDNCDKEWIDIGKGI